MDHATRVFDGALTDAANKMVALTHIKQVDGAGGAAKISDANQAHVVE